MKFESVPIVRLELESMKHSIITALGLRNNQLAEVVENRIEDAIKEFDFDGKVSGVVSECLEDMIHWYFKYGEGNVFLKNVIQEAFDKIFKAVTK